MNKLFQVINNTLKYWNLKIFLFTGKLFCNATLSRTRTSTNIFEAVSNFRYASNHQYQLSMFGYRNFTVTRSIDVSTKHQFSSRKVEKYFMQNDYYSNRITSKEYCRKFHRYFAVKRILISFVQWNPAGFIKSDLFCLI